MAKYLVITLLLLGFVQCSQNQKNQRAFFYWKTNFVLTEQEKLLSAELGVKKFYIRFFDVDWSSMRNEAVPLGIINTWHSQRFPEEFIPCVFITNTVMLKSSREQLDTLASRIYRKVNEISESLINNQQWSPDSAWVVKNGLVKQNWHEIQIDCDWTEKSKGNYFYFLSKMKEYANGKQISATLRLWQLKYQQKAGIPPADRVMLMCYSTGNPGEYQIENSIATFSAIKPYIQGQEYVIPVDFALPIYNWAVLFRNKKYKGILRNLHMHTIQTDTGRYQSLNNNLYRFKSDTIIGNDYIRFGDEIRLESLSEKDMGKLVKWLSGSRLYSKESTVSFFAWDTLYIQNYGKENIQKYFDGFGPAGR
jgi:hypothetical protein